MLPPASLGPAQQEARSMSLPAPRVRGRSKRKSAPKWPCDPEQPFTEMLSHDGRAETARASATMRDAGRSFPSTDPTEGIPRR